MLTVFGSTALDTIRTPKKTLKNVLGGAATFAAISASNFVDTGLIAVVGKDFPKQHHKILSKHLDLQGFTVKDGKTFRYDGKYDDTLSTRSTLKTELNVLADFKPTVPEDYRKSQNNKNERFLYPLNEVTNFKVNKFFRQITKNISMKEKILTIKGRKFIIKNYYDGISRFDFKDLCAKNIGAEDYIKIAQTCNFIIIENIPNFNNDNSNQQQRFITLIDIFYEKNIPLMITSQSKFDLLTSSMNLKQFFKRTISRLYELTSIKYSYL